MHTITGAKVTVIVESELGNMLPYRSHPTFDASTQTEDTKLSPLKQVKNAPPPAFESPQRRAVTRRVMSRTVIGKVSVVGLPGKTAPPNLPSTSASTTGKCQECGIIFESKNDELFRKKHGK